MEGAHGGRVTLRLLSALVSTSGDAVDYAGQLSEGDKAWDVRARVRLADGAVDITAESGTPPQWLVTLTRSLLRTAFRSAQAGAPWPRRLNRWRAPEGDEGSEP